MIFAFVIISLIILLIVHTIKDNKLKPEEKKETTLVIKMSQSGISVQAPGDGKLFDEPICYYLLEKGKDYIKRHNAMQTQSKIVKANQPGGIMNFAKRFKR